MSLRPPPPGVAYGGRRLVRLAAGCLAALVLAPATTPGTAAAAPVSRVDWVGCGPRLECATVPVPLDWARPGGATIALSVIRHLASRPGQRIGSLLVNPGGPGDSGVADVADRGDLLDALTEGRFDIVGWDPRGSGNSAPVSCFADAAQRAAFWGPLVVPSTRADERRYLPKTVELARRCGARNGALLAHISTADQVRDVDHLRRLVGDRQLTFLGESNGTLMGQTYANMFPGRVRAMALDGVVDPIDYNGGTAAALAAGLTDADLVFGKFLELCEAAGPARCALAGHGESVTRRVHRLLDRLRRMPLPAPGATPPGQLTYGEALALIKFNVPSDPADWPLSAQLLESGMQGDGSVIKDIAAALVADQFRLGFEQNVALTCADAPARQDAAQWPRVVRGLTAVSRIGGLPFGWLTGAPCASWPTPSAVRYTGPWNAVTRTPILLVNMRFEPNTPLVAAQRVQRRLGNAVLLIHDGYGHLNRADPSACVSTAIGSYLVRLATPPHGTVCPSDRQPFDPDFGQP
ncbi:MAG TPA: alpha/beta fold hydrolase [Mycobacteriales bacterium]|nr:alpha/beta fold hydrolase [Mycobacteriales bacterium]